MAKKAEDRIKALEVALKNESTERDFYLQHAARTKNEFGKKMFMDKGKWPERLALTVKGTKIKSVLNKMIKVPEKTAKADSNDLEAVKIAINFEKKGERFYTDLQKTATDPKEKAFFGMIAEMEREHRLS